VEIGWNLYALTKLIKRSSNLTRTCFERITQRSTGRQKQARFVPVGKLLAKERYRFKSYSFFAFAACELSVIRLYFILAHCQMSQLPALNSVTKVS
jgi:hypothetical protein